MSDEKNDELDGADRSGEGRPSDDREHVSHPSIVARGWEEDEPTQLIEKACREVRRTATETEIVQEAARSKQKRTSKTINATLDRWLTPPKPKVA